MNNKYILDDNFVTKVHKSLLEEMYFTDIERNVFASSCNVRRIYNLIKTKFGVIRLDTNPYTHIQIYISNEDPDILYIERYTCYDLYQTRLDANKFIFKIIENAADNNYKLELFDYETPRFREPDTEEAFVNLSYIINEKDLERRIFHEYGRINASSTGYTVSPVIDLKYSNNDLSVGSDDTSPSFSNDIEKELDFSPVMTSKIPSSSNNISDNDIIIEGNDISVDIHKSKTNIKVKVKKVSK